MKRGPFTGQAVPSSQIWLYYTSKMVTVIIRFGLEHLLGTNFMVFFLIGY